MNSYIKCNNFGYRSTDDRLKGNDNGPCPGSLIQIPTVFYNFFRSPRLQDVSSLAEVTEAGDVLLGDVEEVKCETPSEKCDIVSRSSLPIPRPFYGQRPVSSSSKNISLPIESSVTPLRAISGHPEHNLGPTTSESSGTQFHVTSGRTEDGLDPMSMTQSAKTMLDMLDEMSLSEGVISDVSFGMFEQDGSNRYTKGI